MKDRLWGGVWVVVCFVLLSGCTGVLKRKSHADMEERSILPKPESEILAENLSFDLKTGQIHYTLPEPALVRIRLGRTEGGALLRTLLDWDYREKGTHTEIWNRKDLSGKVDFSDISDIAVVFACRRPGGYPAGLRGFEQSPDFDIVLSDIEEYTNDGVVIVEGKVPVRIVLAEKDKVRLANTGYEIIMYVDQVFLVEGEKGISPFNYWLNTKGFNEGYHHLTVNVASFSGEIGTKTAKFFVKGSH